MILDNPIFAEMILPFLLVFVVVFAILQKSKILGEGKEQIDAMAALVIGLIVVTFGYQAGIIVKLMGWLAVGVAVMLCYLILYGFVAGDFSSGKTPKWLKNTTAILAGIFLIGVIIYVTGLWNVIFDWLLIESNEDVWVSIIMIVLVIGVAALAVNSSKKKGSSG